MFTCMNDRDIPEFIKKMMDFLKEKSMDPNNHIRMGFYSSSRDEFMDAKDMNDILHHINDNVKLTKEEIDQYKAEGICEGCPGYEECHGTNNAIEIDPLHDDRNFVEVNDYGDAITIVGNFPGIIKEDFSFELEDRLFYIIISKRAIKKRIELPCNVSIDDMSARYNNGVLEIRMNKAC